jgi:hypothetical protein
VVAARGKHQQRLGQRVHGLVQHQLAQRLGQRRATGLAGHLHLGGPRSRSQARASMCEDLPAPSMPSKVMKRPAWSAGGWMAALVLVHRAIVLGQVGAEDAAAVAAGHEVQRLGWAPAHRGAQRRHARHRDRRGRQAGRV